MGAIKDKFYEVYRDFATDGVEASGPYNPEKSEQRAIGPMIESAIANAGLGSLVDVVYATRGELDADLAHDADTVGLVFGDAADANNDLYIKTGASGAGAWTLTTTFHDVVAGLGQPFVDAAEAAADRAEAVEDVIEGANSIAELPDTTVFRSTLNGAERDGLYQVIFPAGTSGQNSYLQAQWPIDGAANVGRTVKIRMAFDRSAVFSRVWQRKMQVRTAGGNVGRTGVTTITSSVSGDRYYVNFEYTLQGDELDLRPYILEQTSAVTAEEETIEIIGFSVEYLTSLSDIQSPIAEALNERDARSAEKAARIAAQANAPAAVHAKSVVVAPSGGDYATVTAALAAITDASATNRYRIQIAAGTYNDGAEWEDKDYVDLIGQGRDATVLRFFQANDVSPALGASESLALMRHSCRIEAVRIEVKNARYGIHLESDGNFPNRVQEFVNCHIEHFGNDDLVGNYWGAQYAIGSGLSSGQVVLFDECTIVSKRAGAVSYHTNVDFAAPTLVRFRNTRLPARQAGTKCFETKPLGSFQPDRCILEGVVFGGDWGTRPDPWLHTILAKQPANHNEILHSGHSNSPAAFFNEDFGEALRIDSATTGAASSVVVSGTAAALIFGDGTTNKFFERKGSEGFSAAVWGWGDISTQAVGLNKDVLTKTLGQRLGDRTGSSRTLTVTVDGAAPINIVFNQNHTAQDNATVIGLINAALGAAATASVFKPGARIRPMFADEECAPKNTSGAGIPFGTVCAFDNAFDAIRPMTSADPAELFAGVAWEDIASGDRGRMKSKGYLPLTDVLRNAGVGATVAFNTTFSIDPATPGQIVEGGAQDLLRAVRNNVVRVA